MEDIFEGFNASQLDLINLVLTLMCGMINTQLCFWVFVWGFVCFVVHVAFSKNKYKKLRESLFD